MMNDSSRDRSEPSVPAALSRAWFPWAVTVHCISPPVTVLRPDYYVQLDYSRLIQEQLSYVTV